MVFSRKFRRLLGVFLLLVALVMLALGQTLLKSRLQKIDYVVYWLTCFSFTGTAALVALIDYFCVKREAKEEQRDLLKHTLHDIEEEETKDDSENK